MKWMKTWAAIVALASPSLARAEAAGLEAVSPSEVGIPYAWKAVLDGSSSVTTLPGHVGAWSWDEDNFPATAKGWTHTSAWMQVELTEPAALTLTLASLAGVPWPSAEDAGRVAGTNLFPSFTLYRGWDVDAGVTTNADGTTLDQNHTFNNRGNIAWAEDVTYLDHLENGTAHEATRTWVLEAGRYTLSLGGNSPATLAEGRQGYRAVLGTRGLSTLTSGAASIDFDKAAWDSLASTYGPAPVLTLNGFFDASDLATLAAEQLTTASSGKLGYTGQLYSMHGSTVIQGAGRTGQPTTFAYLPGDPASHVGHIGLGGVARFAVLGGVGGTLLYGDYTLQYDSARLAVGGSGWYLQGNIPPVGPLFDLLEPVVSETDAGLAISGKLAVTFEVANLLYGTPADTLKTVGSFVFTGDKGNVGRPRIRGISVVGERWTIEVEGGLPGASCALQVARALPSAGAGTWEPLTTAVFDARGRCTISGVRATDGGGWFFRVQLP